MAGGDGVGDGLTGTETDMLRLPMMMRLREMAVEKLEGERWMYEGCGRGR